MARFRVSAFGISMDGFGAGAEQSLDNPMGVGGMQVHGWAFETKTFRAMHVGEGDSTGVDEEFAARSFENVGAWILGRNMFGPVRGSWGDESWKGWWGDTPPYHVPVFVLTHYARAPIEMKGGTTFYFITDGIESALRQARESAGGRMFALEEEWRLSASTSRRDPLMSCISQFLRYCWERERIFFRGWICRNWELSRIKLSRAKM